MKTIARRSFLGFLGSLAVGHGLACGSSDDGSDTAPDLSGSGGAPSGEAGTTRDGGTDPPSETFEYVIVGSGAGGGPLAANLARNGHTVLLLEAGDDHGDALDYQVPVFHAQSTEDPAMRWDYFVKHYDDPARAALDDKLTKDRGGVLYPRAGTLGGCTAHNAMITVYPHDSDWDGIAKITGDTSWSAANMRRYFELLENCQYVQGATGHGYKGWLRTSRAASTLIVGDGKLEGILASAVYKQSGITGSVGTLTNLLNADLNADDPSRDQAESVFGIPIATDGQKRVGPRDYLLQTVAGGNPLTIRTGALATRVLLSADKTPKALGVEYLAGKHLYRADPGAAPSGAPGALRHALATREVILSCGAFNTPQLLKLSGIGPRPELTKLGIPVAVELPGVGENLQDRYEVGVVSTFDADFGILDGCTFGATGDPCLATWATGSGVYTTNGGVAGIVKKSSPSVAVPDLFIFLLPAYFKGYFPGYAKMIRADHRHYTWAILKAHTANTAGSVLLHTSDPRDVPDIHFRYFDEGTNDAGQAAADLAAVVTGVKFVRGVNSATSTLLFAETIDEVVPGPSVASDDDIATFVKNEAWGHHASCTCKIGADGDRMAVLDSAFRVRGTKGLRVVDASVFPRIPGFFIVAPIYMISEKATDAILADAGEMRRF